ncbi:RusA family crossover junction endodeoxyribonuclease, partial [Methylobacterium hispanicum]
ARTKAAATGRRAAPPRKPAKGGRLPNALAPFPEVSFAVSLEPRPKERPRTFLPPAELARAFAAAQGNPSRFLSIVRGGDEDTRIRHHTYTPKQTAAFEGAVRMAGAAAMRGREPIAVSMGIDAILAFDGDAGLWPTDNTDGDLDNLVKAVLDAVNGVVFKDDRLVVEMRLAKICLPEPAIALRVRPADPTLGGLLDLLTHGTRR